MNKIGFHFVNTLPATINENESKSFFYVKKEVSRLDSNNQTVVDKFAEVFLGIKDAGTGNVSFHSLTPPANFYSNKLNGINLLTNYEQNTSIGVNLTLNDICNYQTNNNITSTSLIFNDDVVLRKSHKTLFFSNVKTKPVNVLDINTPNLFFGLDIGSNSTSYSFNGNLIFGSNIKFTNTVLNNNLIFGIDLELSTPELNGNKTVSNNLYLGGIYINTELQKYIIDHKIEDNIFIKNFGYGNLNTNFHMALPLRLSVNTELLEAPTVPNYPRVAVVKNDGTIGIVEKTLYFPTPSFHEVVAKNNTTTLPIKVQGAVFSNINYNLNISDKILNNLSSGVVLNNYFQNDPLIEASTIIGKDLASNATSISGSILYGDYNLNFNSVLINNIVYGKANLINSTSPAQTVSSNVVFGFNNANTNFIGNGNIIFGNDNIKNNHGNRNIIFGSNNGNQISNFITTYSDKIIIGHDLVFENNVENELIIGNGTVEQVHLITGSFTNKSLKFNAKLNLDFSKIPNSTGNILFNKILTSTADGEIGYESKPATVNNSYSSILQLTGGKWIDNRKIYRQYVEIPIPINTASVGFGPSDFKIISFEKCFLHLTGDDNMYPPKTGTSTNAWNFKINTNNGLIYIDCGTTHTQVRYIRGVIELTYNLEIPEA